LIISVKYIGLFIKIYVIAGYSRYTIKMNCLGAEPRPNVPFGTGGHRGIRIKTAYFDKLSTGRCKGQETRPFFLFFRFWFLVFRTNRLSECYTRGKASGNSFD